MALLATAAVGFVAVGAQRTLRVARKDGATHGIKFSYSIQKDAYADLEFMNDVGCSEAKQAVAGHVEPLFDAEEIFP